MKNTRSSKSGGKSQDTKPTERQRSSSRKSNDRQSNPAATDSDTKMNKTHRKSADKDSGSSKINKNHDIAKKRKVESSTKRTAEVPSRGKSSRDGTDASKDSSAIKSKPDAKSSKSTAIDKTKPKTKEKPTTTTTRKQIASENTQEINSHTVDKTTETEKSKKTRKRKNSETSPLKSKSKENGGSKEHSQSDGDNVKKKKAKKCTSTPLASNVEPSSTSAVQANTESQVTEKRQNQSTHETIDNRDSVCSPNPSKPTGKKTLGRPTKAKLKSLDADSKVNVDITSCETKTCCHIV